MQLRPIRHGNAAVRCGVLAFVFCFAVSFVFMQSVAASTDGLYYQGRDFVQQQVLFTKVIAQSLRDGRVFYSHLMEVGMGFQEAFFHYGIGSPFTWLISLFSAENYERTVVFWLALKIACAALSAFCLTARYAKTPFGAFVGAVLYALSPWQITNLFYNFSDALVFFPLLILGLDLLMEDEKPLLFPLAVAAAACTNLMFFVSEGVFLILYFLLKLLCGEYTLTRRRFFACAGMTVLGLMLSGAFLIPSVIAVLGHPRRNLPFESIRQMLLYPSDQFSDLLRAWLLPGDFLTYKALFMETNTVQPDAAPAVFGIVLSGSWCLKNRKSCLARLLLCCFVFSFIPVLNSAFTLFSSEYYARWLFMPSLFLSITTALALEDMSLSLKGGFLMTSALVAAFCANAAVRHFSGREVVRGPARLAYLVALAASGLAFCALLRKFQKKTVWKASVIVVLAGYILASGFFTGYYGKYMMVLQGFRADDFWNDDIGLNDEGYYRVDASNSYINKGLVIGRPSLSSFTSALQKSESDFYAALGVQRTVNSWYTYRLEALRALMSCRYIFVTDGLNLQPDGILPHATYLREGAGMEIYEYDRFIPMGFAFRYAMAESEFMEIPESERCNALLRVLVVPDGSKDAITDTCEFEWLSARDFADGKYTEDMIVSDIEYHRAHTADRFEETRDGFAAEYTSGRKDILFLSVFWNTGFRATVNGKPSDVLRVDIGMIGIAVEPGVNEISLSFRESGAAAGILSSAAAVFSLTAFQWIRVSTRRRAALPV